MSKLFLIPNAVEETRKIPCGFDPKIISHLRVFFVEEPKAARALLKSILPDFPLSECQYHDLNEHTTAVAVREYGKIIKSHDVGIISESGCPCVADPGADLVLLAHQLNVEVVPLVGPSSILLALMSSGLNGQNFAFNGYLPKDEKDRVSKIKLLEQRAVKEGQTQIFMDTPYRNTSMMEQLLKTLDAKTLLCVALDIQGADQMIKTQPVSEWRKVNLQLPKKPALFIINK